MRRIFCGVTTCVMNGSRNVGKSMDISLMTTLFFYFFDHTVRLMLREQCSACSSVAEWNSQQRPRVMAYSGRIMRMLPSLPFCAATRQSGHLSHLAHSSRLSFCRRNGNALQSAADRFAQVDASLPLDLYRSAGESFYFLKKRGNIFSSRFKLMSLRSLLGSAPFLFIAQMLFLPLLFQEEKRKSFSLYMSICVS